MTDQEEDDKLARQLNMGKVSAFETIFHRYHGRLCHFAKLILKDVELSKNVVSDRFADLWHSREEFKTFGAIRSFLYLSTFDKCLGQLKSADPPKEAAVEGDDKEAISFGRRCQWLFHHGSQEQLKEFRAELIFHIEALGNICQAKDSMPLEYQKNFDDYVNGVPVEQSSLLAGVSTAHFKMQRKTVTNLLKEQLGGL